ncbi:ABC-2 type transport system ATP-binding protein [Novosphingobium kunmingense]|uniref:ABC-2 type transport system ATP-binding protein n=1 Tax=Novosphingobium kunmingense TaxID=1211806 RepID=A0A2N0I108_9SPHN|nr:ABC transporter ATP-binding protein [Novosphingobium kunmingense]PKB24885.1 ABC-2 type transport system ATP-binding protein [Novosphingobium kunmingense]
MSDAPAIAVRGLTKRFGGRTVVDHVDLAVQPGRICGFLGPNGSGKTTTLRMICGLLIPDEGEGEVLGLDLRTSRRAIKQQIGYMTQKFGLFSDLSIAENLEFIARVYSLDNRNARVEAALERLGLTSRAGHLAGKLSGGWKQRLALAAAVLHEPRILLLDEPTAGVDPQARREFWDQIHALAREGMTVLVSTHYMDEAERCHEIAYIAYGVMLAHGTTDQVIAASGLSALEGEGPGADRLAAEIEERPGVAMAAPFGTTLHVCGTDPEALRAAVAPWAERITWRAVPPTLEDVFINLMRTATDGSVVEQA